MSVAIYAATPEENLSAAVDEWADALRALGEELLKVVSLVPWNEIFWNLWGLSWSILDTVACFIIQGYFPGLAFASAATEGCCGGSAAIELDFDPITVLLIPMVKAITSITNAIIWVVVTFGPTFVTDTIPQLLDLVDFVAGNLC